jgi:hypothetical protein
MEIAVEYSAFLVNVWKWVILIDISHGVSASLRENHENAYKKR